MLCQIFTRLRSRILSEKGTAAMMVISTIAILSILAAGMSTIIVNEMQMIAQYQNRTRAYYVAQAGIAHALWELNTGNGGGDGLGRVPETTIPGSSDRYETRYENGVLRAWGRIGSGANTIERRISVKANGGAPTTQDFTEDFTTDIYKDGTFTDADWNTGLGKLRLPTALNSGIQQEPAIAYNSSSNQFMAVWEDDRDNALWHIYAQRVNANGSLPGSNFCAACSYPLHQPAQAIAYNSTSNQFMITWYDDPNGNEDIYAQKVNANGTLDGSNFAVTTNSANQYYPAIAYNSTSNQFMVVWDDYRNGNWDIYAQKVNANGTLDGSNFAVTTNSANQYYPAVAYNSTDNQFMISWADYRNGNWDIYAQKVNANGTLDGSNFAVTTNTAKQDHPAIVYNSTSNQFMVVWDDRQSGLNEDIYAQKVNANGTLDGSNFAVAIDPAGIFAYQDNPAIAYNSTSNQFLITWLDTRNGNYDIYAQKVNANGTLDGSNFAVTTNSFHQRSPAIAYNSTSNQFLITYHDNRSGKNNVYAQGVDADGNVLWLNDILISFEHVQSARGQSQGYDTNVANPDYSDYSVDQTLSPGGSITIQFSGRDSETDSWSGWFSNPNSLDGNRYIRWKADLSRSLSFPNSTPEIDRIVITYQTGGGGPVSLDYSTWRSN